MSQVWYYNIHEVMDANDRSGRLFFSHGAMRFFKSRISPTIYGGRYFITSESYGDERVYSVRECGDSGDIMTHHSLVPSHKEAVKLAKELAKEDRIVEHIRYYSRYR
jgi:hypothetical protein